MNKQPFPQTINDNRYAVVGLQTSVYLFSHHCNLPQNKEQMSIVSPTILNTVLSIKTVFYRHPMDILNSSDPEQEALHGKSQICPTKARFISVTHYQEVMVKTIHYCCREPKFSSQNLCQEAYNSGSRGFSALFWTLWILHSCMWLKTHTYLLFKDVMLRGLFICGFPGALALLIHTPGPAISE